MQKRKEKLIFYYLKTGGGHISCARSVAGELCRHKDAEIVMIDGLEDSPKIYHLLLEDSYSFSQNNAKWLFEGVYALNKIPYVCKRNVEMVARVLEKRVRETIVRERPDKIVIFHGFFVKPVQDVCAGLGLDIPIITVCTDPFTTPNIWFYQNRNHCIVFSKRARDFAFEMGVTDSKCKVFDFSYIINNKYSERLSNKEIDKLRVKYGFAQGKRVVLVEGGGDGVPHGPAILNNLLRSGLDIEVAIVCGRNKGLKAFADRLAKGYPNLKVFGFVDFVYDLVSVADVVITKAGPATVIEILLLGKIPVVNSFLWEQEKGNVEFVVSNKVGFYEPKVRNLASLVGRIFDDSRMRGQMIKRINRLGLRNSTADVAEYIYRFKEK